MEEGSIIPVVITVIRKRALSLKSRPSGLPTCEEGRRHRQGLLGAPNKEKVGKVNSKQIETSPRVKTSRPQRQRPGGGPKKIIEGTARNWDGVSMSKREEIQPSQGAGDPARYHLSKEGCEPPQEGGLRKFDESVDIAMRLGAEPKHSPRMVRGTIVPSPRDRKSKKICVIAREEIRRPRGRSGYSPARGAGWRRSPAAGWTSTSSS